MRLKLLISLLVISILAFGQDSLQMDSMSKSSKSYITHSKKFRKKNKNSQLQTEKATEPNDANSVNSNATNANNENYQVLLLLIFAVVIFVILVLRRSGSVFNNKHVVENSGDENLISGSLMRVFMSRRDYYRNVYLKSDEWKRKRYVVLKRDNWRCVYCGTRATEVHHKKYAKRNIGKEPIEWLVSVCKPCHVAQHSSGSSLPHEGLDAD